MMQKKLTPQEVLEALARKFPNVYYRLTNERPWGEVPRGYVVGDETMNTLAEDEPVVSVMWSGYGEKKNLKNAEDYLGRIGYEVGVEPPSKIAGTRKRIPMALKVFR